jgi:hypothetical protein
MTRKPQPLYVLPQRKCCPVCGAVSYSPSGIHPQCAMQQADAERMKRIKVQVKPPAKAPAETSISPWQKICPKCKAVVHIRRKTCACGCHLGGTNRP